jgi:GNAT superfamily N-acetyltransferase
VPIEIRLASAADDPAITEIRRETWLTAYAQIIDPEIIERVTAPGDRAGAAPRSDRTSLVAVSAEAEAQAAALADARVIVGYASFGPERDVAMAASVGSGTQPGALTEAGLAGESGEMYTLYVTPQHWSTGVGRALTGAVIDALRAAGYRRVVLWTLAENARARRFYVKAGFAPDGAINILPGLGNVEELRYVHDL